MTDNTGSQTLECANLDDKFLHNMMDQSRKLHLDIASTNKEIVKILEFAQNRDKLHTDSCQKVVQEET